MMELSAMTKNDATVNPTLEQIKTAISEGIVEAMKNPEIHCRYAISPDEHSAQHAALKGFMEFTDRINGIKWKTAQTLIVMAVVGLFSMMLFGAYVKLKLTTFFGF